MTAGISLEQTVLGHALNSAECFQVFAQEVHYTDLIVPNHQVIAYCLTKLSELGVQEPDEDSFQLVVSSFPGEDKDYGGAEYIRMLKKSFEIPTQNYPRIVEAIKLQSVKHKIGKNHLEKILRAINNPISSARDIRSAVDAVAELLGDVDVRGFGFSDSESMHDLYLHELNNRTSRPFFTTGLPQLDDLLSEGFSPSKLTVIAGFTGMAKSTTAIAMAHRIAVAGFGVAFFSMETQKEGVWDKLVSSLTQIPIKRLKKEAMDLTKDERTRIDTALYDLSKVPILINDRASMSMSEMRYQIMASRRRGFDPKVVFIDLFGKLDDVDTGENLAAKIQLKCKQMRVLAQELNVHFVMIVQVGRQGFGRSKSGDIKRPTLIDIKNSNAYSEESDIVLFVHRNKYYVPELVDDILEIHVAKQRDGESGTVCYHEMFADRATIMSTEKRPHDLGSAEA